MVAAVIATLGVLAWIGYEFWTAPMVDEEANRAAPLFSEDQQIAWIWSGSWNPSRTSSPVPPPAVPPPGDRHKRWGQGSSWA